MPTILGISAYYHDAAAAIIVDGNIVAAAQEERFTRKKHTPAFPTQAIKYCLQEVGCSIDDLDAVVFYDKPLLKFERLLQTYYAFAPKGFPSFLKAIPVWLNEKLFLKRNILKGLLQIEKFNKKKLSLLFAEHHLSHAASAFYPSPYENAAILTIDGVGEWSTASIGYGSGNSIKIIKELSFPHSVGLLYSAFTYYLGFTVNSGEYKLMGLAPYGDITSEETQKFIALIKDKIVSIRDDGSIWLNQEYFNYATGLRMVKHKKWESLFGFKRKTEEQPFTQQHCNLALAIQTVTEEIVTKMAIEAKRLTGATTLCMAGGVALNCVAVGKLMEQQLFSNIYVQPAAGDAGGAIGAALSANHLYFNVQRTVQQPDGMKGTYLGPRFYNKDIELLQTEMGAKYEFLSDRDFLLQTAAKSLADGMVVGWFQGRMEFGPRALGNRSILADPRNPEMQKKLNLKIKFRESFRPFAPSVKEEDASQWFDLHEPVPYMTSVVKLKESIRRSFTINDTSASILEKLNAVRSELPAITHMDFSARIQTVSRQTNSLFWQLLEEFKKITGYSVLVNTSFNVRGEPIVCSPTDAYRCFMATDMDMLVIENYVFYKNEQPNTNDKEKWKTSFEKD